MSDVTITITLPAELVERATKLGLELEADSFARVWAEALRIQTQFAERLTSFDSIDPHAKDFKNCPPGEQVRLLMHSVRAPIASLQGYAELLQMYKTGQLTIEEARVVQWIGTAAELTRHIGELLETFDDAVRTKQEINEHSQLDLSAPPPDVRPT